MKCRAMRKARKVVEMKQKAFDAVAATMEEVDKRKNVLAEAIELRLKSTWRRRTRRWRR